MGILFNEVSYAYQAGTMLEHTALEAINLQIEAGQFVTVLGSTGSGKSTLLQHMNGILSPTEGCIQVFDYSIKAREPLRNANALRKRVGLVFQFPEQQLFAQTVAEDLTFGPLNFGAGEEEALQAAYEALDQLGLDHNLMTRHPYELSGGQMRKLAIATVLASHPDIIVLDEPTASLDPASREELLALLHKLCKEYGKTIVIVTHRFEEAMAYTDQLMIMRQGKLILNDQLEQIEDLTVALQEAELAFPPTIKFIAQLKERCVGLGMQEAELQGLTKLTRIEDVADWIVQQFQK